MTINNCPFVSPLPMSTKFTSNKTKRMTRKMAVKVRNVGESMTIDSSNHAVQTVPRGKVSVLAARPTVHAG